MKEWKKTIIRIAGVFLLCFFALNPLKAEAVIGTEASSRAEAEMHRTDNFNLLTDHSKEAFLKKYNIVTKGKDTKIILDTDIRHMNDDTYALIGLLRADEMGLIDLLGITAAGANALTANVTYTTLATLDLLGRGDVPVYQGTDSPLRGFFTKEKLRKMVGYMPYVGAYRFLDNYTTDYTKAVENRLVMTNFPAPVSRPKAERASDFIIEQVHKYPGKVTIMALAGLTNIAEALKKDPTIAKDAAGIIYMGGVFDVHGEYLPNVEINFWYDPDAAVMSLNGGWKKQTIVPHDAAITCVKGMDILERFERSNVNKYTDLVLKETLLPIAKRKYGPTDTVFCWDPITVAVLLCPDLITSQRMRDVAVCNQEGIAWGSSFAYEPGEGPDGSAPAMVVSSIDRSKFFDFFVDLYAVEPQK